MSELFEWIGGRTAWEFFHGIDVALLLLGLAACALAAIPLVRPGLPLPFPPGHALTACGSIVTTVVLIFIDTGSASAAAFIGLLAALAILAGGLLMGAAPAPTGSYGPPPNTGDAPPQPGFYPDPRSEARLRWWDGRDWTDRTST